MGTERLELSRVCSPHGPKPCSSASSDTPPDRLAILPELLRFGKVVVNNSTRTEFLAGQRVVAFSENRSRIGVGISNTLHFKRGGHDDDE
jgi:hypothetical protein